MIDLGTLAGLHQHQHQLAAYCPRCDRWAEINFAVTVDAGLGDRRLPIRVCEKEPPERVLRLVADLLEGSEHDGN